MRQDGESRRRERLKPEGGGHERELVRTVLGITVGCIILLNCVRVLADVFFDLSDAPNLNRRPHTDSWSESPPSTIYVRLRTDQNFSCVTHVRGVKRRTADARNGKKVILAAIYQSHGWLFLKQYMKQYILMQPIF